MALPVSLDEAKRQLKIELDDHGSDDEVQGFVDDAAAWVERYTGHLLEARDVVETFDRFDRLELRAWPIASDAAPVITYPYGGALTTVSGARVDTTRRPARVLAPVAVAWPGLPALTPVTVTLRAGYEPGDALPGNLKRAMLVLISGFDADRGGGDDFAKAEAAAKSLCSDFRLRRL